MPQNRTKTGKFRKGSSGNPGGRPKRKPEEQDALQAINRLSLEAVQVMQTLLREKNTPAAVKVKIAEALLDRTFGKPHVSADIARHGSGEDFTIVITGSEDIEREVQQ